MEKLYKTYKVFDRVNLPTHINESVSDFFYDTPKEYGSALPYRVGAGYHSVSKWLLENGCEEDEVVYIKF